jgi:mono/diheme cytochrome c family protein
MNKKQIASLMSVLLLVLIGLAVSGNQPAQSPNSARDPGVRDGAAGAGAALAGLSAYELKFFAIGKEDFEEIEEIANGLGPRANLDSCAGCHSQPAIGGTSPAVNPQIAFAKKNGARNRIPPFLKENGPALEARFLRHADGTPDGGVHELFTIAGRSDAPGCNLAQPDFAAALAKKNVILRIPTPVFGAGLIEQIPDKAILTNQAENAARKSALGIHGHPNVSRLAGTFSGRPNRNGHDGTIARFGWKAQNTSLLLFSGEAYNVEMGVSNELFQTERNEAPECQFAKTPNDGTSTEPRGDISDLLSAIQKAAVFMRFLAPPTPSNDKPGGAASIARGKALFSEIGCALCHTPTLHTGNSTVGALANRAVNLYSDLLLHDMGPGLADGVSQGQAGPREFRTAPLWGLGQRIFSERLRHHPRSLRSQWRHRQL